MSEHFLLELVTSYQNNPEALSSQLQDIPYQKITESGWPSRNCRHQEKVDSSAQVGSFRTMMRT